LARQPGLELAHRLARPRQEGQGLGPPLGARLDLVQAVAEGMHQGTPALLRFQQVVLDVGVAADHPHVPQDLEQHARGTAGAPLTAQAVEEVPAFLPQEAENDLPVGEGGVVVGDLADAHGTDLVFGARL